jgi:hypothetical protein
VTANGEVEGRTEAPDSSRVCTLSSRTRGDTTDSTGLLQRLLEDPKQSCEVKDQLAMAFRHVQTKLRDQRIC